MANREEKPSLGDVRYVKLVSVEHELIMEKIT